MIANVVSQFVGDDNIISIFEEIFETNNNILGFIIDSNALPHNMIGKMWFLYRNSDNCIQKLEKYMNSIPEIYRIKPTLPPILGDDELYSNIYYEYFDKFIDNMPEDPNETYILRFIKYNGDEVWIRRNKPNDPDYQNNILFKYLYIFYIEHMVNTNIIHRMRNVYNILQVRNSTIGLEIMKNIPYFNIINNPYLNYI